MIGAKSISAEYDACFASQFIKEGGTGLWDAAVETAVGRHLNAEDLGHEVDHLYDK